MGKKLNKALHPTDAFRKEERKKEIKKNKFQKAQVCAFAPFDPAAAFSCLPTHHDKRTHRAVKYVTMR
jgi:hypothetical protein